MSSLVVMAVLWRVGDPSLNLLSSQIGRADLKSMNWVAHITSKHLKHHADLWQVVPSNPQHLSFSHQNSGGNWDVTTGCSFQHIQNQFLNQTSAFSICGDLLLHVEEFFTPQFSCVAFVQIVLSLLCFQLVSAWSGTVQICHQLWCKDFSWWWVGTSSPLPGGTETFFGPIFLLQQPTKTELPCVFWLEFFLAHFSICCRLLYHFLALVCLTENVKLRV